MEQIRIMLVDDHPVVRHGLKSLLSQYADLLVVGESDGGMDLLNMVNQAKPDIMLLDIRLGGVDGLDLSRRLQHSRPQTKIIILTSYDDDVYFQKALKSGVKGYLLKSDPAEILIDAIRTVHSGKNYLTANLAGKAFKQLADVNRSVTQYQAGITDQEIELLKLMANGESVAEIARALFMSERSVKRRLSGIMQKLGVSNRVQAVAEAFRMGFL